MRKYDEEAAANFGFDQFEWCWWRVSWWDYYMDLDLQLDSFAAAVTAVAVVVVDIFLHFIFNAT